MSRDVFTSQTEQDVCTSTVIGRRSPKSQIIVPKQLWDAESLALPPNSSEHEYIRALVYDLDNRRFIYHESAVQPVKSLFVAFNRSDSKNQTTFADFFILKFHDDPEASARSRSTYAVDEQKEDILRVGLVVDGEEFNLVGCSNSQLQKGCFCFLKRTRKGCDEYIEQFFPGINKNQKLTIPKRVKYAGLLFSGCKEILELPEDVVITHTADLANGKYKFTDGCGIISWKLAKYLTRKIKRMTSIVPSIWQVKDYSSFCLIYCIFCVLLLVL